MKITRRRIAILKRADISRFIDAPRWEVGIQQSMGGSLVKFRVVKVHG